MVTSLVGYTGFVGSNIAASHEFTHLYNSKNIEEAFGTQPDLLVYSGVRAEKYLANQYPEKDLEVVKEAFENIKKIQPKKLVLISTVDVYKNPNGLDESAEIDTENLHPYGLNRYYLEQWVREEFEDALIIRLPGLYGKNIKKNFIYDYINVIPFMLKEAKFEELAAKDAYLKECYAKQDNGFYKCLPLEDEKKAKLKESFKALGFTALNFTDSRGLFQFYDLKFLWQHIQTCLENNVKMFNPATEPVSVAEVYEYLEGKPFVNEVMDCPPNYDYRTEYAEIFGGKDGYIFTKEFVKQDIKEFIESQK